MSILLSLVTDGSRVSIILSRFGDTLTCTLMTNQPVNPAKFSHDRFIGIKITANSPDPDDPDFAFIKHRMRSTSGTGVAVTTMSVMLTTTTLKMLRKPMSILVQPATELKVAKPTVRRWFLVRDGLRIAMPGRSKIGT